MKVIDKRAISLTTTFGDLAIGEAFQDERGKVYIKTDFNASMYYNEYDGVWYSNYIYDADEFIIPLEVTYTFEREGEKK